MKKTALILFESLLAMVAGAQDGDTNTPSQPLYMAPVPRTNSIVPVSGFYPEWWQGEDACTADDGIPDQWKRRTHTFKYGPDDDPDGDGLTNLQEFWLCTDSRRARTMGGIFTDGELVGMGRDPLAPIDYTPNEYQNLWSGSGYGFYAPPNSDGFVPWYALGLPAPSSGNADVWVEVKTTRSAALDYSAGSTGSAGGIIFPAGQYTVKLRLPLDCDTMLRLLPCPGGETENYPSLQGELWVAKMTVGFATSNGQSTDEKLLTLAENHKALIVELRAEVKKQFAPLSRFGIQSAPADDGNPANELRVRYINAIDESPCYCGGAATLHEFTATNLLGLEGKDVRWSANYGTMSPGFGIKSALHILGIPSDASKVTITATANIDDTHTVKVEVEKSICTPPCGVVGYSCCNSCPNFSIDPYSFLLPMNGSPETINVVSNNCAGFSGGVDWTVDPPSGLTVVSTSDSSFTFDPSESEPGGYFVTAKSQTHPGYYDTAVVYIVGIKVNGFSADELWPLHTNMFIVRHQVTCFAETIPPNFPLPIEYSLVGDNFGATIDRFTGVITPGYDRSGELTVRASFSYFADCYDEDKITIRAVPVAVTNSVIITDETTTDWMYYGAGWLHSFSGTGGSLAGVIISETVRKNFPDPFKYKGYFNPGMENSWVLDSNGTMNFPDVYLMPRTVINAALFTNLPQTASSSQWYHWRCELCRYWPKFTGPNLLTYILDIDEEGKLIFITNAYGVSYTNDYKWLRTPDFY